jgi:hypothetical protein
MRHYDALVSATILVISQRISALSVYMDPQECICVLTAVRKPAIGHIPTQIQTRSQAHISATADRSRCITAPTPSITSLCAGPAIWCSTRIDFPPPNIALVSQRGIGRMVVLFPFCHILDLRSRPGVFQRSRPPNLPAALPITLPGVGDAARHRHVGFDHLFTCHGTREVLLQASLVPLQASPS